MRQRQLSRLAFDNQCIKRLPIDPESKNYVRSPVKNSIFSRVLPTSCDNPQLVSYSKSALELININNKNDIDVNLFSGNKLFENADYAAHCYCGYQFGYFSGQLGDGATMYIGEIINDNDKKRYELQFKGAGLTPYSRQGDGRKVLRSSIREFLCSEAMNALNIPTTRAGTLIVSDTTVERDIMYDGNPKDERIAIITRIAPTFFRFGSLEIIKELDPITQRSGSSAGNYQIGKVLLDYIIEVYYPHITSDDPYLTFFKEIVTKTAILVAKWNTIGWCHGVLNTDNMSIIGLTIDYGPFGFIENFNQDHICNSSDDQGRYSYKNQQQICKWNCIKLAESISTILSNDNDNNITLDILTNYVNEEFDNIYTQKYYEIMRNKLGLFQDTTDEIQVIDHLINTMQITGNDFTNTFRSLSSLSLPDDHGQFDPHEYQSILNYLISQSLPFDAYLYLKQPKVSKERIQLLTQVFKQHPIYAKNMGITQEVLDHYITQHDEYDQLCQQINEQDYQTQLLQVWQNWLQEYALCLSSLSKNKAINYSIDNENSRRKEIMNQHNPKFILRNWLAQYVIEQAEDDNFVPLNELLQVLLKPYDEQVDTLTPEQIQFYTQSQPDKKNQFVYLVAVS